MNSSQNDRWKPKTGESYYTIVLFPSFVVVKRIWGKNDKDDFNWIYNNCFETYDEACSVEFRMRLAWNRFNPKNAELAIAQNPVFELCFNEANQRLGLIESMI